MNVRERHETQCHVESGVFIVPLIVMVIYIYIYIYIYYIVWRFFMKNEAINFEIDGKNIF